MADALQPQPPVSTATQRPSAPPPPPPARAPMAPYQAVAYPAANQGQHKSRTTYILLAWFLGVLGVHNFYAGYNGRGIAQVLTTVLVGWLLVPLIGISIWVIVEMFVIKQDAKGVSFV